MLKRLLNPTIDDICPNCKQRCNATDILCPNCGKDLDELFEQLPDAQPVSLENFIKGLCIIVVGICIPIVFIILGGSIPLIYGSIYDSGGFIEWRSLGSPPEKVTKLLGICGGDYQVCVQTENDQIYISINQNQDCNESSIPCWEKLQQPVDFIRESHYKYCVFSFVDKNPPDDTVQIVKTNYCGHGGAIQTNYALLANGSVWVWKHRVTDLNAIMWLVVYAAPVAIISFIIGLVVSGILAPMISRKWIATTSRNHPYLG